MQLVAAILLHHCELSLTNTKGLDIVIAVTIMQPFTYAPSLYDARPLSQNHQSSITLRTNHRAGAKSTPNTPNIFQEIT